VAGRVADCRQLRPPVAPAPHGGAATVNEVGADVPRLQPGRIDRDQGRGRDQARSVCAPKACCLELGEGPPFSSRRSA
jgi:hypothetical protein